MSFFNDSPFDVASFTKKVTAKENEIGQTNFNVFVKGMTNTSKINRESLKTLKGVSQGYANPLFGKNPNKNETKYKFVSGLGGQTHYSTNKAGVSITQNKHGGNQYKITSVADQLKASKDHRRKSTLAYNEDRMTNNPNLPTANVIRKQLGLKPIEVAVTGYWKSQRRVQTGTRQYGKDRLKDVSPEDFLTKYYEKKSIVNWAKGYDLKLGDSDTGKFRTGENNNYTYNFNKGKINKRNPITFSSVQKYITKKPENEAEKVTVLYDKFGRELDVKTTRYLDLYDPVDDADKIEHAKLTAKMDNLLSPHEEKINKINNPTTKYRAGSWLGNNAQRHKDKALKIQQDKINKIKTENIGDINRIAELDESLATAKYQYYTVSDEQLTKGEKYKTDLVSEIKQLDTRTDKILTDLPTGTPDTTDDDRDYKSMRLRQLEKEYEREIAEFNSADTAQYNWKLAEFKKQEEERIQKEIKAKVRRAKSEAQFSTTYPRRIPRHVKRLQRRNTRSRI
jgi:hypothetical protein